MTKRNPHLLEQSLGSIKGLFPRELTLPSPQFLETGDCGKGVCQREYSLNHPELGINGSSTFCEYRLTDLSLQFRFLDPLKPRSLYDGNSERGWYRMFGENRLFPDTLRRIYLNVFSNLIWPYTLQPHGYSEKPSLFNMDGAQIHVTNAPFSPLEKLVRRRSMEEGGLMPNDFGLPPKEISFLSVNFHPLNEGGGYVFSKQAYMRYPNVINPQTPYGLGGGWASWRCNFVAPPEDSLEKPFNYNGGSSMGWRASEVPTLEQWRLFYEAHYLGFEETM